MSYLSIRNMHRAEAEKERRTEELLSGLPQANTPPVYYWHFERKTRRGWSFMREFIGSPEDAGSLFSKHFTPGKHRLRRVSDYKE